MHTYVYYIRTCQFAFVWLNSVPCRFSWGTTNRRICSSTNDEKSGRGAVKVVEAVELDGRVIWGMRCGVRMRKKLHWLVDTGFFSSHVSNTCFFRWLLLPRMLPRKRDFGRLISCRILQRLRSNIFQVRLVSRPPCICQTIWTLLMPICPEEANRMQRLRAYMLNKQQKRHHSTSFQKNRCMKSNDHRFLKIFIG